MPLLNALNAQKPGPLAPGSLAPGVLLVLFAVFALALVLLRTLLCLPYEDAGRTRG